MPLMAWQTALIEIDNKPAHMMVDDRFEANPPADQLPHLAWFGVYCATESGDHFRNPSEGPKLDAVEGDLIKLCDRYGNGWAAYVHRLDTRGLREYYVYFGEGATLEQVLPEWRATHPTYRLEFDLVDDLTWAQYRKWLGWLAAGTNPPLQRTRGTDTLSKIRMWFGRRRGRRA
jgi:hypothetical protein